ncbi:CHAT domain-containing protein [Streptomyces sp. NPDC057617]|uniref:CHAT domain-containing tetratricopeptide repeat protein n=1 Tax=Streptomyces sp. NPDC057617 TaxID=3346184 RepID=UPI0036B8BAC1
MRTPRGYEAWIRRAYDAWERFGRTGATADLDEAIAAYRTAAAWTPRRHKDRANLLYNLQVALHTRNARTGALADLDEAVAAGREAVALTPAHAGHLSVLGAVLAERFDQTGRAADLEEAVALGRRAITLRPTDPYDVEASLTNLGTALHQRFQWTGSVADLEESVDLERTALALTPPRSSARKGSLTNLGSRLASLYLRTGRPEVLDEAVAFAERAVRAEPAADASRPACLTHLGNALHLRYERDGVSTDLDESVALGREAVALTSGGHTGRAPLLVNLVNRLALRYEQGGADADIEEALLLGREALAAAPFHHPERPGYLSHVVNALALRSLRSGGTAFLDEAVALSRAAAEATRSTGHQEVSPARQDASARHEVSPVQPEVGGGYLTVLGHALRSRFEQAGGIADLDEAITVGRDALAFFPTGSPGALRQYDFLVQALYVRFRHTGSMDDLGEAISLSRASLAAASGDPVDQARPLALLGMLLWTRYERTHDEADLDEAIRFCREAVEATVHEDELAARLSNLAAALVARFQRTDVPSDLDDAIDTGRRAVRLTPRRDTDLPRYLSNLAYALTLRFQLAGGKQDLDEAVTVGRDSVTLIPAHHPERARFLGNLGNALKDRYEHFAAEADLDAAVAAFTEAAEAESSPASHRVGTARSAAGLIAPTDPARAADLLEAAVLLLPEVTPRRLARGDQQHALGDARRLAGDAAALVLAGARRSGTDATARDGAQDSTQASAQDGVQDRDQDSALRALRLLETGRTVLIGQALDARDDLSELRARHPGLATRFTGLRDRLDQPAPALLVPPLPSGDGSRAAPSHSSPPAPEPRAALNRPALAAEFTATLAEIRAQPGLASFGLPPALEDLVAVAEQGPLVVLNVSTYGSHALLLTRDGVSAVPLPALGFETVIARTDTFLGALDKAVAGSDSTERRAAQRDMREVLEWLWDAAAGPVLEKLGFLDRPAGEPDTWPRLWWVPSGLLSLLPLHAAGHHTEATPEATPATAPHTEATASTASHAEAKPSTTPHTDATPGTGNHTESTVSTASHTNATPATTPHTDATSTTAPRTVMDRVVSSYTPSVRALHHARRHAPAPDTSPSGIPRALGVAMPVTPGLPGGGRLHHASEEVAALRGHLPGLVVLDGGDDPAAPVKAEVLKRLPDCPIAHFACHGHSDGTDPSLSRLLLQDHERDPLTIAALAPVVLDRAQLAYLSACRTASVTHRGFLDEALHLASAFQIAGFPQVVGTLWEVDDRLCVTVADGFYRRLRTAEGGLDTRRGAYALHSALRDVRDGRDLPGPLTRSANPFLWAAHIHVGA